ncbi:hypothetical protein P167DRAFT_283053 [Morchella conica CCBAS932]|uniref:Uncharacterized protein n=1 Tax=Morchella conica CCBAS932 TaxID=1392247 RepID=A0A3N4KH73_9PEZI|nr:hypothetical protein P167DRAFT_283053 [Morchella conica CCBAS932]
MVTVAAAPYSRKEAMAVGLWLYLPEGGGLTILGALAQHRYYATVRDLAPTLAPAARCSSPDCNARNLKYDYTKHYTPRPAR